MARILRAQRINKVLGGVAVLPWELDELPDEWLTAFEMLSDEMPEMSKGFRELDAAFERIKARFNQRH